MMSNKEKDRQRKVDYVRRQLDAAAEDGVIPYCMDESEDRADMALWIVDNILPL